MATLTDDESRAHLVQNALTRCKAAKIAMVHLYECWEIDETLGILRVRLRDDIDME
jgi:transposase-like protein